MIGIKYSNLLTGLLIPAFSLLLSRAGVAQDSSSATRYGLYLDAPLTDIPFMSDAARAGMLFNSFSMQQSLAVTKNLHSLNYYTNNHIWHKLIKPSGKHRWWLNRLAAQASSGLVDYVFTYKLVVFSPQWLHEEFHRAGLTIRGIRSYDETYNRFHGGFANGSVSRVSDADLIRMKRDAPPELVRSFAAGIESEFLLLRGLQKDNFFGRARYPDMALNILLTKHAVDYVNQFKRGDFDGSIDSMNYYGTTEALRDYVGWDFSAWVYDLHRPDEPYEARGIHPSGSGINRAIKRSMLTPAEERYLAKMGRLQYLNFLSPFLLGIHRIPLGEQTAFNVAVRHYLNSFGYDLSADVLLDHRGRHYLLTFHGYRNRNRFFPGLEIGYPSQLFSLGPDLSVRLFPTAMFWLQPANQGFYDRGGSVGGLMAARAVFSRNRIWQVYTELEAKTRGWVAGNPYLRSSAGVRVGLQLQVKGAEN